MQVEILLAWGGGGGLELLPARGPERGFYTYPPSKILHSGMPWATFLPLKDSNLVNYELRPIY
jgi:hypothetical protein